MQTKTLNTIVFAVSQVLNLLIILYFAVLLAKLVWWVINPALGDVYIERPLATEFDTSVKYVNNRYPFGIITKPVESVTVIPTIASQIDLTGIYFNPPGSISFITYNNKSHAVKVGENIMDNATLKEIFPEYIIVRQNGVDAKVYIDDKMKDTDPYENETYAPDTYSQNSDPISVSTSKQSHNYRRNSPPISSNNNNDLKERRRKIISDFAQKTTTPNDSNTNNNIIPGTLNESTN